MNKDFVDYVINKEASVRVISIVLNNSFKNIEDALLKDIPLYHLGKKSKPELLKLYNDFMLESKNIKRKED